MGNKYFTKAATKLIFIKIIMKQVGHISKYFKFQTLINNFKPILIILCVYFSLLLFRLKNSLPMIK